MTLWIGWCLLVSALLGLAAAAADRSVTSLGAPRRFIWIAAMLAACLGPTAVAFNRAPDASGRFAPAARGQVARTAFVRRSAQISRWQRASSWVRVNARRVDRWVAPLWILASGLVLAMFARALIVVQRRRSYWHEAQLGAGRAFIAPDAGPAVVGFVHPRIVLPEWALDVEAPARELMLRHETEHIRAGDPRTLLVAGILLVAFPWNAALWWMMRRLRLAIEIDCDSRVVRTAGGSRAYGMVLLAVGERHTITLPLAASLAEPRPFLERRIQAMIAPRPRRPFIAALPSAAIALLVATAALVAPRPTPLAAQNVVIARSGNGPQLSLTRDQIRTFIVNAYPSVLNGDPEIEHVILVLDEYGNLAKSLTGKGPVVARVGSGDQYAAAGRFVMAGSSVAEAGARVGYVVAGRGFGSSSAQAGARGGSVVASGGSGSSSAQAGRSGGVVVARGGAVMSAADSARIDSLRSRLIAMRESLGAGSGIEGVEPGQLVSSSAFSFRAGEIGPNVIYVMVATLKPGATIK